MGYYKWKKTDSGKYHFNLHAGNNQVILSSQTYEAVDGCKNGIASCQENGKNESMFEKNVAKDGSFYFNLKAGNGQIIGKSEMYTTEAARDNGIASVVANCTADDVREEEG